jgi:N-acetylglucosaminyldiphosphoundecaprenol N-acetyl-beta-D-mannosaminyltransferase
MNENQSAPHTPAEKRVETSRALGLDLTPFTMQQSLDRIEEMIRSGKPGYFITANLHYAMISENDPELHVVNREADFILADGMPLVWASKRRKVKLPERVAGSDLIPKLCALAAEKGYRVFLLGAAEGVAVEAAAKLKEKHPAIQVVGTESPPFRPLSEAEEEALIDRIRQTKPDILVVSFGQPKGEKWIHKHLQKLGVPVCAQVGATIDFLAGRVRRSPKWMHGTGAEWIWRMALEPRRLTGRYLQNMAFLAKRVLKGDRD